MIEPPDERLARSPRRSAWECTLAATVVLMTTIPFRWAAGPNAQDQEYSNPWLYALYLLLLAVLLLPHLRAIAQTLFHHMLGVLLVLVVLSASWSDHPSVTLQKAISLTATTLLGGYLATRFTDRQRFGILGSTFFVAAAASVAAAILMPSFGIMGGYHEGEWCGIYSHKNVLGQVACVGLVCALVVGWTTPRIATRWLCIAAIGLEIFVLVMTRSQTAMVTCAVGVGLFPVTWLLRQRGPWGLAALLLLVLGGGAVVVGMGSNQDVVLQLLGRDVTLTGRMQLWEDVMRAIGQRPWLGYGYGVFWQAEATQPVLVFSQWGNPIAYSHNGGLEVLLDLGAAGLSAFLVGYATSVVRAVRRAVSEPSIFGRWPLVYLSVFLLFNLTEASILAHRNLLWVLYVAAVSSRAGRFTSV